MKMNEGHPLDAYIVGLSQQKGIYGHWAGQRLTESETPIPNAFDQIASWRAERRRSGHLLVALDFDGTISPIVSRPQDAQMLAGARAAIERLLKRADTDVALVSGRSLPDLRARVDIDGVYYSGNHGLQIEGPDVHETLQEAVQLVPRIQEMAVELAGPLAGIAGVYLENKELSLSVHSRMVADDATRERVYEIVRMAHAAAPEGIKLTHGKRIIEVRPDVDWHKGNATLFLIDCVETARRARVFPLFAGDDLTDEDAFRALSGRGAGIVVAAAPPAHTAATSWVPTPEHLVRVLEALAE
jgi:trehalose 6-phosphate phosphatase